MDEQRLTDLKLHNRLHNPELLPDQYNQVRNDLVLSHVDSYIQWAQAYSERYTSFEYDDVLQSIALAMLERTGEWPPNKEFEAFVDEVSTDVVRQLDYADEFVTLSKVDASYIRKAREFLQDNPCLTNDELATALKFDEQVFPGMQHWDKAKQRLRLRKYSSRDYAGFIRQIAERDYIVPLPEVSDEDIDGDIFDMRERYYSSPVALERLEAVEAKLTVDSLLLTLRGKNDKMLRIIQKYYQDGMTFDEVSLALPLPLARTKVWHERALAYLATKLQDAPVESHVPPVVSDPEKASRSHSIVESLHDKAKTNMGLAKELDKLSYYHWTSLRLGPTLNINNYTADKHMYTNIVAREDGEAFCNHLFSELKYVWGKPDFSRPTFVAMQNEFAKLGLFAQDDAEFTLFEPRIAIQESGHFAFQFLFVRDDGKRYPSMTKIAIRSSLSPLASLRNKLICESTFSPLPDNHKIRRYLDIRERNENRLFDLLERYP